MENDSEVVRLYLKGDKKFKRIHDSVFSEAALFSKESSMQNSIARTLLTIEENLKKIVFVFNSLTNE